MTQRAGLYVHVPFCSSVCPYCDFAVLIAGPERRAGFVPALLAEAEQHASEGWSFDTLYLGGGTPSSLTVEQLEELIAGLRRRLPLAADAWITLEANPDDVTRETAVAWRALGIGTISLGLQSLDGDVLSLFGRRHSAAGAREAFDELRASRVPSLSVDLIFGYPGHQPNAWRRQLNDLVSLTPDHVSCYQLTVHEGTVFGHRRRRGELVELTEDAQAALLELTHLELTDAGYQAYEVSNFAVSQTHRSRHNQKYWGHVPYLGLGPSAHSFDGRRRWWNLRKVRLWQAAVGRNERPVEGLEELSAVELALEAVMLGLRTSDGVDLEQVASRWGVDLAAANAERLARLCAGGYVELNGTVVVPTLKGMAVADALARELEVPEM